MKSMDNDNLFLDLKERYSPKDAKALIDHELAKYGPACRITFYDTYAEIVESWKIKSTAERHRICEIVSRTGLTERTYENLAAEWEFHNVAYDVHFMRESAKDVALDYKGDPRRSVRLATDLMDKLNIE